MENTLENNKINNSNKKKIICLNLIKMFSQRKLINEDKINSIYEKIIKNINEKINFEIKLTNDKTLVVTFIDFKITSLKKIDNIDKIIKDDNHKVFIVYDIQKKIWEQLVKFNIEVFYDIDLMINTIDHDLVPEHTLLTKEEINKLLKSYTCSLNQLPKIHLYDMISRYYNAKVNDVFRIKRKNISSGHSIYYRIVVKGNLPDYNDLY